MKKCWIFVSSPVDMPGIDLEVMLHWLKVDLIGLWNKRKEALSSSEEIDRLTSTGFIREVNYLDLLANIVLMKKANGKWWMCIDFTKT